jgi:hypothetical protein
MAHVMPLKSLPSRISPQSAPQTVAVIAVVLVWVGVSQPAATTKSSVSGSR